MEVLFFDGSQLIRPGSVEGVSGNNRLVVGLNPPNDLPALEEAVDDLKAEVFRWVANVRLLLALPTSMKLLPRDQWGSRSSGSCALYPAFWETPGRGKGGGILLQLLSSESGSAERGAGVCTSWHYHGCTVERFYPVYGNAEIRVGETDWQRLSWRTEVRPYSWHQLRVRSGLAITLIRMDGPCSVRGDDCMDDHYYE